MASEGVPDIATDAVLVRSESMPADSKLVKGKTYETFFRENGGEQFYI